MTTHERAGLSRRGFLRTGAAAALGLATTPTLLHAGDAAGAYGGFTVGVQTYSFRELNLERALQQTQKLGLRYVELYRGHVPLNSTPEQIKAAVRLCRQYQITPIAFGVE